MSEVVKINDYDIKDLKAVRTYENVAAMKSDTKLREGQHVKTKGYYSVGDGGHGEYLIVNDTDLIEDNGSVHRLTNGLRAKLIIEDSVNVKQFGAKADNETDDIDSFTNAIAYINNELENNKVYVLKVPTGFYRITHTINLSYYVRMKTEGFVQIYYDSETGVAINIEDTLLKNVDFESGLYKSPIISGKNGGLRILGNGRDKETIGIQLGGDSADSSTTQKIRNGIEYIQIERFGIGLKFGTNNNYWNHFTEVTFTNNLKGLSIGTDNVSSIHNTDENISFDKCIFGGNSYAIYEQAQTIFKFYKCSFDMNETLYYTDNGGKLIGFYGCWIERNGLKKFIDTIPEANKGMFINVSQTRKQIILSNCYITYGGNDEGSEVKNYLIRGLFSLNGDNNHIQVGLNFPGGGKYRLFLTDDDVYLRNDGFFTQNIVVSKKDSVNLYPEFNDLSIGDLPTTVNNTFGDYKVTRIYRFTGEVEDNDYYNENKMLHFTTPGGGYYEFESNKMSCSYGEYIRPVVVFKVDSDYLSANSGLSARINFYDENDTLIESTSYGAVNKQESIYFTQASASYMVPEYATKYSIEVHLYSNTSMAQEQSEDFYIYGIYSYKMR